MTNFHESVATVTIKGDKGVPTRINATDYDKKKHGDILDDAKAGPVELGAPAAILSPTAPGGINGPQTDATVPPVIPNTDGTTNASGVVTPGAGAPLVNAPSPQFTYPADIATRAFFVNKTGKKFFVTDDKGAKVLDINQPDDGFKDEAEAGAFVANIREAVARHIIAGGTVPQPTA